MALKLIKRNSEPHSGYGAGPGTIDTEEYVCPCGMGRVIKTRDNIPGFRETDITIECDICAKKYGVVDSLSDFDK